MINKPILKTAVEIYKILGISDRTITRWAVKGMIVKQGKGEYCLVSVFDYYRSLLLEDIGNTKEKIELARSSSVKQSLLLEKMTQSIKIITANSKIKEHELEVLEGNLVNREDAKRVFNQAYQEFCNTARELPSQLADEIVKMNDPNEIQHFLEGKVKELLSGLSVERS